MPKRTINFDTVCKTGLALPGVEERTAYGSPALILGYDFLLGAFTNGTAPNSNAALGRIAPNNTAVEK